MKPILPLALLSVAFGCGLTAQTVATFPSDHAAIPNGNTSTQSYPYSNGVSRIMILYESWDLNVPLGNQITGIGFRADGTTIAYGKSLQLEVRMGTTQQTAATMLSNYDSNYFSAPQTVFGPGLFVMPDLNNVLNPNPEDPYIWLTLTTPYTVSSTDNLLVEFRIFANTNGGASFPYRLDVGRFDSPITTGPIGCMHSGNQIPELLSRPTKVGGTWRNDLRYAPANQLAVLFLNLGTPLSPQYPLSTFFAGIDPSCQGQVALLGLYSLTNTTSSAGTKTWSVPIPNDRGFNNLTISSQAVCFDFFAPGGLVVSNGDQIEIGIDPAMTMLYSQGNATATTGSRWQNFGLVTLFDHN